MLWRLQGAADLLTPMLMAQMSCVSAHHMQHAALAPNVLVYLCMVAERAHKALQSREGFTPSRWPCCTRPESIKTACPRQLPGHKTHLYLDVHAHPPSVLQVRRPKKVLYIKLST